MLRCSILSLDSSSIGRYCQADSCPGSKSGARASTSAFGLILGLVRPFSCSRAPALVLGDQRGFHQSVDTLLALGSLRILCEELLPLSVRELVLGEGQRCCAVGSRLCRWCCCCCWLRLWCSGSGIIWHR